MLHQLHGSGLHIQKDAPEVISLDAQEVAVGLTCLDGCTPGWETETEGGRERGMEAERETSKEGEEERDRGREGDASIICRLHS